jgi:hypothetical protein
LRRRRSIGSEIDLSLLQAESSGDNGQAAQSEEAAKVSGMVWSAVDQLSPPQRATVLLFYRHDFGCQEIAQVLQLPPATVKSHLHRLGNCSSRLRIRIGRNSATWLSGLGRKRRALRPSPPSGAGQAWATTSREVRFMRCEQARQLFDAYLDGELSTALATELGTHRLKCASCRRELALLEVTGHIIRSDAAPKALEHDFTERLMQCVQTPRERRIAQLRKSLLVGGPLAAAAVIVLAFAGLFDAGGTSKVAGVKEVNPNAHPAPVSQPQQQGEVPDRKLEKWLESAKQKTDAARRSGESLQNVIDSTLIEVIDVIEDEETAGEAADGGGGAEESAVDDNDATTDPQPANNSEDDGTP